MSDSYAEKLVSKRSIVINLALSGLVFLFFTITLQPYVPLHEDQPQVFAVLFAALTSSCLTGVFWLAASMFAVVWKDDEQRGDA